MTQSRAGRKSSAYNFLLSIFNIFLAAWLGYAGIGALSDWSYYLGLLLMVLGLFLYLWVQRTLGRFFSLDVVIYEGQTLVQSGPFRLIRHPAYAGVFMIFVGIGLMAESWIAVAIIFVATSVVLGYRVKIEEKVLNAEFGEQYVSYAKRVKRFIPFLF